MAFFTPPTTTVGSSFGRPTTLLIPNDWRPDVEYPLIVLLHSYGQTSNDIRGRTGHAEAHNFDDGCIIFAPTGLLDGANTHWNYWTTGPTSDFAFLAGCIEEIMALYNISWVGVEGFSNGGYMAIQLSIQRPDLIHTMFTFACAAGVNDPETPTGFPIPHYHCHGTVDGTVNPAGDATGLSLPGALSGHGGVGSVGYTDTAGTVAKSWARNGGVGALGSPGTAYDLWSLPVGTESANEEYAGSTSQTRVIRALATGGDHGLTVSSVIRGGNPIHTWMRDNHRTP